MKLKQLAHKVLFIASLGLAGLVVDSTINFNERYEELTLRSYQQEVRSYRDKMADRIVKALKAGSDEEYQAICYELNKDLAKTYSSKESREKHLQNLLSVWTYSKELGE